jgi:tetratricopeptide (TPR) repeat protein
VDGRTDVYALGLSLYEVLTRRPAVRGKDFAEVLANVVGADPPAPRALERRVPKDLETVVLKAIEKDPARRYATAAALAADLRSFHDGAPVRARRVAWPVRVWRRARRRPLVTALATSVVVVAALVALLLAHDARRREVERLRRYDELLVRHQFAVHGATDVTSGARAEPERLEEAEAILDEAIRLAPERSDAYLLRVVAPVGSLETRLSDIDRLSSMGLSPRDAHLLRAAILVLAGEDEGAREQEAAADALPEGERTPWMVHYVSGVTLFKKGRYAEAVSRLTLALTRMPPGNLHRTSVYLLRSVAKERLKDVTGALQDVLAIQPEGAVPWSGRKVRAAMLWRRLGQGGTAERLLDEALHEVRAQGTGVGPWRDLCHAAADARDWASAERYTREGMAVHPEDDVLWGRRVQALYHLARHGDAVATAEAAPPSARGNRYLRRFHAASLVVLGRAEEALDVLGDMDAPGDRSLVLGALRRHEEALAAAKENVERSPDSATAHFYVGQMLRDLRRPAEAIEAYRRSIALDPWAPGAHAGLASSLIGLGRMDDALEAAERCLELDPRHADGWHMKAAALEHLSLYERALEAVDRALAVRQERPAALLLQRAGLLQILGRDEEAVGAFDAVPEGHDPCVPVQRAWSLLRSGRWKEALAASEDPPPPPPDRGWTSGKSLFEWAKLRIAAFWAGGDLDGAAAFAAEVLETATGGVALTFLDERVMVLEALGRFDEALEAIEAAKRAMPEHAEHLRDFRIRVLTGAGRFDDALRENAASPNHSGLTTILQRAGRNVEARAAAKALADGHPEHRSAWTLAVAGEHDAARAQRPWEWLPETRWEALARAETHAMLGETDDAIRWLEKAAAWGFRVSARAAPYPVFEALRADPRFVAVWRRITLP